MNKKITKITKETMINDAIEKYPNLAEDFFMLGMMCVGCPMSQAETVEQGCKAHLMTDKQINEFIEKLNKKLEKNKPSNKKVIKKKGKKKK